jgi:hypothetical protein
MKTQHPNNRASINLATEHNNQVWRPHLAVRTSARNQLAAPIALTKPTGFGYFLLLSFDSSAMFC